MAAISVIRFAWYAACLPALLLNYFGQGALALRDPHVLSSSSFYALYRGWTTLAMVGPGRSLTWSSMRCWRERVSPSSSVSAAATDSLPRHECLGSDP
jgi:hypothetical protein